MFLETTNELFLPIVAKQLLASFPSHKLFLFHGEMGSGKTTFIKEICKTLGVESPMSSPTFPIVNEYITDDGKTLYHFDLYRLKNLQELHDLGFSEYLSHKNYTFIEWPELGMEFYEHYVEVLITQINEEREIKAKAH